MKIRKSNERGQADHGWLQSQHSFSFGDYFDPQHSSYRSLRVINEDHVSAEQGFGMHPHQNMEIISYVISGSLEHQDSMGNKATLQAGDVQRISAGRGIRHQEYNPSSTAPVHFLQIWIQPESKGTDPSYADKSFGKMKRKLPLDSSRGRSLRCKIRVGKIIDLSNSTASSPLDSTHRRQPLGERSISRGWRWSGPGRSRGRYCSSEGILAFFTFRFRINQSKTETKDLSFMKIFFCQRSAVVL